MNPMYITSFVPQVLGRPRLARTHLVCSPTPLKMRYGSPRPRRSCRKADDDTARPGSKALLPKEAYNILRTYFTQTNRYPDKAQLAELLEELRRKVPGCEDCKIPKLQAYFKERRKTEGRARMAARFKASRDVEPVLVEIIEASSPVSEASSTVTPGDPDEPQFPRPSLPSPHLNPPTPSLIDAAPRTFADLAKWLQEQNRRFMDLSIV